MADTGKDQKKSDSLDELLEKMEVPLRFSAQDNFRNMQLVRGLDSLMRNLLVEIQSHPQITQDLRIRFSELQAGFDMWEKISALEKKFLLGLALELAAYARDRESGLQGVVAPEQDLSQLDKPVQFLKGVGPRLAGLLQKKEISSVEDLLYFLPRKYEDRRSIKTYFSPSTRSPRDRLRNGSPDRSERLQVSEGF